MSTENSEHARWFAEEVHPHEPSLKAYLRGCFPGLRDVDDVVHESYLRLWRRHLAAPVVFARSFLFQVARRVALDIVRRDRISPLRERLGDLPPSIVIEEGSGVVEAVAREENIRLLSEALATLPPRARNVLVLRKFEGLSQKETAARLGIAEKTVDEHLARGMKRLGQFLRRRGMADRYDR